MPGRATLVRTTQFGVRPLGVRGEPLHNAQARIRDVVRRRLGDRHFHLLAEPQAYPATGRIDWYADGKLVLAAEELPEPERDALRAEIDGMLADIDRLGAQLEKSTSEDAKLAGRVLRLAARRPDDDNYLFLVGKQPVLICWGYDKDTVGAVLPPAFLASATPTATAVTTAEPVALTPTAIPGAAIAAASVARSRFPWLVVLLVGLLGVLLILGAAYGLRLLLPVPPELQVTNLPPEPSPPPASPPDVTIEMKGAIDGERERESKLRSSLASLREEFRQRQALCKQRQPPPPPEPPKPPPAVERKPAPKPEAKPEPRPEVPKPAPKPKAAEIPKSLPPPPPPPVPPVTQPPPGMLPCNADAASGGQGVTRNRHYLGSKPGPVTILYNMKQIPDQMNVYYRGRLVASTNQPTSYRGSLSFNYQPEAGDYSVVIEVVGPRSGTEWNYRLDCPT